MATARCPRTTSSSTPSTTWPKVIDEFTEKLGLKKYALYVQDYGAPVGYRLASKHPERITAIVVQNGNAYDEGLDNEFWKPIKEYWKEPNSQEKRDAIRSLLTYEATKWQYTDGVKNPELVSPDGPPKTSSCSIAKGTTKSNSTCFSATEAIRPSIRAGKNTFANTSRRC